MQYFHGTKKSPFNSSYFNNANLTLSQPNKVPTARKRSNQGMRGVGIEGRVAFNCPHDDGECMQIQDEQ